MRYYFLKIFPLHFSFYFIPYFSGDISLDEAVHLAKRNSRRFAKRQFTWFRGQLKNWYEIKTEVQRKNFEEIIPHKV
ncbi:MAG: hypothetical protein P8H55_02160 [Hellea sp.]|nr:hypothetical protein [Hellea sp.]